MERQSIPESHKGNFYNKTSAHEQQMSCPERTCWQSPLTVLPQSSSASPACSFLHQNLGTVQKVLKFHVSSHTDGLCQTTGCPQCVCLSPALWQRDSDGAATGRLSLLIQGNIRAQPPQRTQHRWKRLCSIPAPKGAFPQCLSSLRTAS